MTSEVGLHYSLSLKTHTYNGHIWVQVFPTRGRKLETFDGFSFSEMFVAFAEVLNKHEVSKVFIKQSKLPTLQLSEYMIAAIKAGPTAVASSLSFEPVHITVERTALDVGTTSLAEAFGDSIFLRRAINSEALFECVCGEMGTFVKCDLCDHVPIEYSCCDCGLRLPAQVHPSDESAAGWVSINTQSIIEVFSGDKLFIPRIWNTDSPWISKEKLAAKYAAFCEERARCKQDIQGDH